jgi:hypothetical protein
MWDAQMAPNHDQRFGHQHASDSTFHPKKLFTHCTMDFRAWSLHN